MRIEPKVISWGGMLSILSGTAFVSLFLALPTGSFWPVSVHNITMTGAILLTPLAIIGLLISFNPYIRQETRYGLGLACFGAILTVFGYSILVSSNIYPPEGIGWTCFTYGFLVMGVGFLVASYTLRTFARQIQVLLFLPAMSSMTIFSSIELLQRYPFERFVWVLFGMSLIILGYFSASVRQKFHIA